jgi:1-deoxy-D-xylulose-5-phosphate reductoisomerase
VAEQNSIALLGSTGSIGTSCLDVVSRHPERLRIRGLAAHRSVERLCRQVTELKPDWAVLGAEDVRLPAEAVPGGACNGRTKWHSGTEALPALVRRADVDTVVCAMVGAAGLAPAWAAVDSGKRVAIANKEALVIAGPLLMQRAAETGATIIPVDSEHSAVYQCLQAGRRRDLKHVILTASGGPFRGWSRTQLETVTPAMALQHPNWQMGPKITIDSATLMNKALEIIEARWLFDLQPDEIRVVIHPQSRIHSLVEFRDGSVISQMSPPDMRGPIQYALLFPDRPESPARATDWTEPLTLELLPADPENFPALQLGFQAARQGGTCGAVLNAANEIAVSRFLAGDLSFLSITRLVQDILNHHQFEARPSLPQLLQADARAREEAVRWTR